MNTITPETLTVTPINDPWLNQHQVQVSMARLDQLHPTINGNKWFKLKENINAAKHKGLPTILSFGGAYSNHIHALAHAGHYFGFKTIGVIRGYAPKFLSATLNDAVKLGMQLEFLAPDQYRQKHNPEFIQALNKKYLPVYIIPEGGANALGVLGVSKLANDLMRLSPQSDVWALACGTGTTLAGLINGLSTEQHPPSLLGMVVHKGIQGVDTTIRHFINNTAVHWQLNDQFHGQGYAKLSSGLAHFIRAFQTQHDISIEPVYTGKLLYGIYCLIGQGYFQKNTQLLVLHTGGLQGFRGLYQQYYQLLEGSPPYSLDDPRLYQM